jgi:DNA-binding CsgD family transcriptional regulator
VAPGTQLLTTREAQVLPMLQQGASSKEIAAALQIGVETVRTHARHIYRKFGVASRRALETLPSHPAAPEGHDDAQVRSPQPPTLELVRSGRQSRSA